MRSRRAEDDASCGGSIRVLAAHIRNMDFTEEEFRKALDNNTYIMFKGLDDVNH